MLVLKNTESNDTWMEVQNFDNYFLDKSDISLISENDFSAWFENDIQPEKNLSFNEISLEEGSHVYILRANGICDEFVICNEEETLSDVIYKELNNLDVPARKASTGTIYIRLDNEVAGFEQIRISDHEPNGRSNSIELNLGSVNDVEEFCEEISNMYFFEECDNIERYVAENYEYQF